jgi:hypothetical protein
MFGGVAGVMVTCGWGTGITVGVLSMVLSLSIIVLCGVGVKD